MKKLREAQMKLSCAQQMMMSRVAQVKMRIPRHMTMLREVQHQLGAERLREFLQQAETKWLRVVQDGAVQMTQRGLEMEDVEGTQGWMKVELG